jgi:hypothetical protein
MGKMMSAMPEGTLIKHVESRDPKPGVINEIEIFVEVELKPKVLASEMIYALRRRGFEVHEVSQTLIPLGAEGFRDPGSEGGGVF